MVGVYKAIQKCPKSIEMLCFEFIYEAIPNLHVENIRNYGSTFYVGIGQVKMADCT